MKLEFIEEQKFTQWWLWIIIVAVLSIPVYDFVFVDFTQALKSSPVILLVILFYIFKLKTRINEKGIRMSYLPYLGKFKNWTEIKFVKVIDYGFVGGWGVRLWTKFGTVYNIRGSKGLVVELNSGKAFIIGTQQEEELKTILKSLGKISE
tara:strand:+ start:6664 stop:7113 length:450 start_codon:yes stop_codon:yes gene_type:complete